MNSVGERRLPLPDQALDKLNQVRDADGTILGYFTPYEAEQEALYEWAKTQFDPEESRRRLREEKGLGSPLAEVMRRIQAREAS